MGGEDEDAKTRHLLKRIDETRKKLNAIEREAKKHLNQGDAPSGVIVNIKRPAQNGIAQQVVRLDIANDVLPDIAQFLENDALAAVSRETEEALRKQRHVLNNIRSIGDAIDNDRMLLFVREALSNPDYIWDSQRDTFQNLVTYNYNESVLEMVTRAPEIILEDLAEAMASAALDLNAEAFDIIYGEFVRRLRQVGASGDWRGENQVILLDNERIQLETFNALIRNVITHEVVGIYVREQERRFRKRFENNVDRGLTQKQVILESMDNNPHLVEDAQSMASSLRSIDTSFSLAIANLGKGGLLRQLQSVYETQWVTPASMREASFGAIEENHYETFEFTMSIFDEVFRVTRVLDERGDVQPVFRISHEHDTLRLYGIVILVAIARGGTVQMMERALQTIPLRLVSRYENQLGPDFSIEEHLLVSSIKNGNVEVYEFFESGANGNPNLVPGELADLAETILQIEFEDILETVAGSGNLDVLEWLLSRSVEFITQDNLEDALIQACKMGSTGVVNRIILSINSPPFQGFEPFIAALYTGLSGAFTYDRVNVAQLLLENEVLLENLNELNALIYCVSSGSYKCLQWLLQDVVDTGGLSDDDVALVYKFACGVQVQITESSAEAQKLYERILNRDFKLSELHESALILVSQNAPEFRVHQTVDVLDLEWYHQHLLDQDLNGAQFDPNDMVLVSGTDQPNARLICVRSLLTVFDFDFSDPLYLTAALEMENLGLVREILQVIYESRESNEELDFSRVYEMTVIPLLLREKNTRQDRRPERVREPLASVWRMFTILPGVDVTVNDYELFLRLQNSNVFYLMLNHPNVNFERVFQALARDEDFVFTIDDRVSIYTKIERGLRNGILLTKTLLDQVYEVMRDEFQDDAERFKRLVEDEPILHSAKRSQERMIDEAIDQAIRMKTQPPNPFFENEEQLRETIQNLRRALVGTNQP